MCRTRFRSRAIKLRQAVPKLTACAKSGHPTNYPGSSKSNAEEAITVVDEAYEVERMLDKRVVGSPAVTEYRVKWKGFSIDECTWEQAVNLEGAWKLVAQYEQEAALAVDINWVTRQHSQSTGTSSRPAVGARVELYWEAMDSWYAGSVLEYDSTDSIVIAYDDDDAVESHDISEITWRMASDEEPQPLATAAMFDLTKWRSDRNSTGYKGVQTKGHMFRARARVNGKRQFIGTYDTAEEAAQAVAIHHTDSHQAPSRTTARRPRAIATPTAQIELYHEVSANSNNNDHDTVQSTAASDNCTSIAALSGGGFEAQLSFGCTEYHLGYHATRDQAVKAVELAMRGAEARGDKRTSQLASRLNGSIAQKRSRNAGMKCILPTASASARTGPGHLVGCRVRKHFEGHGIFNGQVLGYSPKTRWFSVQYDDGDAEEISRTELDGILLKQTADRGHITLTPLVESSEGKLDEPGTEAVEQQCEQPLAAVVPMVPIHSGVPTAESLVQMVNAIAGQTVCGTHLDAETTHPTYNTSAEVL